MGLAGFKTLITLLSLQIICIVKLQINFLFIGLGPIPSPPFVYLPENLHAEEHFSAVTWRWRPPPSISFFYCFSCFAYPSKFIFPTSPLSWIFKAFSLLPFSDFPFRELSRPQMVLSKRRGHRFFKFRSSTVYNSSSFGFFLDV